MQQSHTAMNAKDRASSSCYALRRAIMQALKPGEELEVFSISSVDNHPEAERIGLTISADTIIMKAPSRIEGAWVMFLEADAQDEGSENGASLRCETLFLCTGEPFAADLNEGEDGDDEEVESKEPDETDGDEGKDYLVALYVHLDEEGRVTSYEIEHARIYLHSTQGHELARVMLNMVRFFTEDVTVMMIGED